MFQEVYLADLLTMSLRTISIDQNRGRPEFWFTSFMHEQAAMLMVNPPKFPFYRNFLKNKFALPGKGNAPFQFFLAPQTTLGKQR